MKLETAHRRALLDSLRDIQDKKATIQAAMKTADKNYDIPVLNGLEIQDYLCNQQIELIEQAIIQNDIDY